MIMLREETVRKVDLYTIGGELERIVLEEFPGKIRGEQYEVVSCPGEERGVIFKKLNYGILSKFLDQIEERLGPFDNYLVISGSAKKREVIKERKPY